MSQMYDDYVWSFVYEQSWLIKETIKKNHNEMEWVGVHLICSI